MRQTSGSYGFKSGTNFNTTAKRLNPTSGQKQVRAPLTKRHETKEFVPLRNQGLLGAVPAQGVSSQNGLRPSIGNPRSVQGKVAKSLQGGLAG